MTEFEEILNIPIQSTESPLIFHEFPKELPYPFTIFSIPPSKTEILILNPNGLCMLVKTAAGEDINKYFPTLNCLKKYLKINETRENFLRGFIYKDKGCFCDEFMKKKIYPLFNGLGVVVDRNNNELQSKTHPVTLFLAHLSNTPKYYIKDKCSDLLHVFEEKKLVKYKETIIDIYTCKKCSHNISSLFGAWSCKVCEDIFEYTIKNPFLYKLSIGKICENCLYKEELPSIVLMSIRYNNIYFKFDITTNHSQYFKLINTTKTEKLKKTEILEHAGIEKDIFQEWIDGERDKTKITKRKRIEPQAREYIRSSSSSSSSSSDSESSSESELDD
jgi:hypothetical protein